MKAAIICGTVATGRLCGCPDALWCPPGQIYPTKDFDTFATVLQQVQMDSEDIPISAA